MEDVKNCLWPEGRTRRTVWMIVDAARDRRAYRLLLEGYYSDRACLFSGPLTPEMELASPYLVQLHPEGSVTDKLIRHGWGNSWGVFLAAEVSLPALRRHLRTLLMVQDQSGRRLLFRYWDPRVLRVFLPTCREGELRQLFGPVDQILLEAEDTRQLLSFTVHRGELRRTATPVPARAAGHATGT
ncbi:MAG: DUF4123 domain-containing protein [Bryobacterales bacterium]|nr:DUF4123 domain-containing protein [Bryobacterales bacterium]